MILLAGVVATLALLAGFGMPGLARPHLARLDPPARGPLIDRAEHPEWKQFLVLAAVRRADELDRLRELPDTRAAKAPAGATGRLATRPAARDDAKPDDLTGSIGEPPGGTIPVDVGETSSTELPIRPPEVTPPVQRPENLKPKIDSTRQPARKPRRAKARGKPPTKPAEAANNPFSALVERSQTQ
jgi:hypothetical protein